jgi:hypothetical protein
VERFGEPQLGGPLGEERVTLDPVYGVSHELPVEPEGLGSVRVPVDDRPGQHLGSDLVEVELERGDDAEVPTSSPEAPEQFGVLVLARVDQVAVGGDDVDRAEVVAGETVRPVEVAEPASEGEPRHPGRGDDAAGRRETERLRLVVEVTPRRATADPGCLRIGVHLYRVHPREVDHQTVVTDCLPCDVVSPTFDREPQPSFPGEVDGGHHVRSPRTPGDEGWFLVDHVVPHRPRLVVPLRAGFEYRTVKLVPERFDGRVPEFDCRHGVGPVRVDTGPPGLSNYPVSVVPPSERPATP